MELFNWYIVIASFSVDSQQHEKVDLCMYKLHHLSVFSRAPKYLLRTYNIVNMRPLATGEV